MTPKTVSAVTEELIRRGVNATCEYPGYVQIGRFVVNDLGETISIDVYGSEQERLDGFDPVESIDSSLAANSDDVQLIATHICCSIHDAQEAA